MKRCSRCKQVKHLSEFYNWSHGVDGKKSACRKCSSEREKQIRIARRSADAEEFLRKKKHPKPVIVGIGRKKLLKTQWRHGDAVEKRYG